MTITYSHEVFTSATKRGIFLKLLFRWKGSIYKLVWHDVIVYISIYFFLSSLYRFVLNDGAKLIFENISLYCGNFANLIPVTFVLGFYVSLIISRWWNMFESVPWPDSAAVWISTCIHGNDDRGRLMRRTIIRYINLCVILALRYTCLPVKKRFPTLEHLVEAGILTDEEKKIMEKIQESASSHCNYWMPLIWAGAIATRARKETRIKNDYALKALIEQIDKFRSLAGGLLLYDWITVPLVYTQVVTLAVYTFLLSTLMGRQFLDPSKKYAGHEVDLVFPIFTFLQFFFYMGWLKVAEALINPFGEDEDDFEMNWIIDRNLQVSYLIVDEMHAEHPEMVRDQFWDDIFPELPYTAAAEQFRTDPPTGSTSTYHVPQEESEFLPLLAPIEDEEDEDEDVSENEDDEDEELSEIIINPKTGLNEKPLIKRRKHNLTNGGSHFRSKNSITNSKELNNNINNKGSKDKLRKKKTKKDAVIHRNTSGSNLTANPSTRTSVSSIFQRIIGGEGSQHRLLSSGSKNPSFLNGGGFLGSTLSIFSKGSRNSRGMSAAGLRRRKRTFSNKYHVGSSSRISNSSQPQSPSSTNIFSKDMGNDDGTSKMSSTSSLNSQLPPSDLSDFYSSKHDVSDILKHDLNVFSSARLGASASHSGGHLSHRASSFRSGSISYPSSKRRTAAERHYQNKMLRTKLETVQQLQTDIMRYLDREIETATKQFDSGGANNGHPPSHPVDPSDMVNILELKTEDLRKALMHRDRIDDDVEDPELLEKFPHLDNQFHHGSSISAMEDQRVGTPISLCGKETAADPLQPQPLIKVEMDIPPNIDSSAGADEALEPREHASEDVVTEAIGNCEEDMLDIDRDECDISPVTTDECDQSPEPSNSHEAVESPANDGGFDIQLSTIEEQPELGYQSDSSETDFLIPLDGGTGKKAPKVFTNQNNLPTVEEESKNEMEEDHESKPKD